MTEAEILGRTYEDSVTVRRSVNVDEDGETKKEFVVISENIFCALSQKSDGSYQKGTPQSKTVHTAKLICFPDMDISSGDILEIKVGGRNNPPASRVESFTAGKPFVYVSHLEVPLLDEKEV